MNHTKPVCLILSMLITILFAQTKTSGGASATQATSDEAVLHELKEVLWPRAYFEQDTKLLDRILADEFQRIVGTLKNSIRKNSRTRDDSAEPREVHFIS